MITLHKMYDVMDTIIITKGREKMNHQMTAGPPISTVMLLTYK